jgi:hypothetical protein
MTAPQCTVADTYYSAFQSANQSAGLDAAAYVCPTPLDAPATVVVTCDVEHLDPQGSCQWSQCVAGRRPEGLQSRASAPGQGAAADYFLECAHLEAASVVAFERMRAELTAHGAPRALVRAARRAARDEARHARVTRGLARRFGGGRATRPAVASPRARSLVDMALENATEGLVRETFGAAVALWQAAHARDAEVRSAMERIAEDECRHAGLSWRVARWLEPRLADAERARVAVAIRNAVEALRAEISRDPDRSLREGVGLPSEGQASALLAMLERDVWSCERLS